ncbi:cid13-like poly(A) RNA polymerase [Diplocarpon rosae]|nr:cid13-like poly(A) RNA polymerase [Diplocarpon rosae]
MFPHQKPLGPHEGNLEDRLRGLILGNVDANLNPLSAHPTPGLPTRVMSPSDIESHVPSQQPLARSVPLPLNGDTPNSISPGLLSPGRKRPNQAQRRQMNSQMSIPIDSRPIPGVQAGRGNGYHLPNHQFGNQNSSSRPLPHHSQRYTQHQHSKQQQCSPQFQNQGPGPSSPSYLRQAYQQNSSHSPINQYHASSSSQFQPKQRLNQLQQQPLNISGRPPPQNRQLYQSGALNGHGGRPFGNAQDLADQSSHLEQLLERLIPEVVIDPQEENEKEKFRSVVELACRDAVAKYERTDVGNEEFDASTVELQCFGSMRTGFATKASDMDLALLTPKSSPPADSPESLIPRLLEKKLLTLGYGARLLTRTRVPIIKLCEKPTEKLRSDLLQERQKWETGFISDNEDNGHIDPKQIPVVDPVEKTLSTHESSCAKSKPHQRNDVESYDEMLANLKQKEEQSLGDFCNTAKRLLRRLGGRDITLNSSALNKDEAKILNDVCKAFISGLSSKVLATRLCQYHSILPLYDSSLPFLQRSLHGVSTQVDGERLALAWNSRQLTEPQEKLEHDSAKLIEEWCLLQDRVDPFGDPTIYNRQLYMACEKLKKINSIQLVVLEQIQNEEAVSYQARAQKIMDELMGQDQTLLGPIVRPIVVSRYIDGIVNPQIRHILRGTDHGEATLRQIGLQHRVLQLALDYEHALEVGVYNDSDRAAVEKYVELLRSRKFSDPAAPKDDGEAALIAKMRALPDPSLTSLNKARDRYKDHLEFPKTGVGIQCDINFSAQLGIHNTQLLRCYSQSDPRVKNMILFIKHWANVRGINTPYRGTLSSYGYVLMVLHYLVNVVRPFVCVNLQSMNKDPPPFLPPAEVQARMTCQDRDVRFWRNEDEIRNLADRKLLNHNHDPIGLLLRGFFEYYAHSGQMSSGYSRGFDWGREVLSLRTTGGVLTKQEKGWVGAKTVIQTITIAAPPTRYSATLPEAVDYADASSGVQAPKTPKVSLKTVEETKEIRYRYLFAIEDPFELDHNVARTVTHNGIVSIRDEFRRAWRLIKGIGKHYGGQEGQLLDPISTNPDEKNGSRELMESIHGPAPNLEADVVTT